MQLKIDHASLCGWELEPMQQAFAGVGLATDYGGPHANGVTHMALVGFEDGSYLELIAPIKKLNSTSGMMSGWAKLMEGNAGPCAWAVGSGDLEREVERLRAAGIQVGKPETGGRRREDGRTLQWETAVAGPGAPGAVLPFMIEDKTPRSLRVQPSASVKGTGLNGIELVIVGVRDLDQAVALFRKAYGWGEPRIEAQKEFGARLAYFAGTPVMLATPCGSHTWLAERLEKFGESPVAYLLGTRDFGVVTKKFRLGGAGRWFEQSVAWFDAGKLRGWRVGVVQ